MKPPLTMRCTIARLSGTQDSFGEPSAAATVASDVACYWWSGASRTANSELGVVAVDIEHILFALGQDIRQGDWITTVTDHLGNVVFVAAAFRIVENVAMQRNHIDCTLRYGAVIGGRA